MHFNRLAVCFLVTKYAQVASGAALSTPSHEVQPFDISSSVEHQYGNLGFSDVLSLPLSLLSPLLGYNNSCWATHLIETFWDGSPQVSSVPEDANEHEPTAVHQRVKRAPSNTTPSNLAPTPQPTVASSPLTTIHIASEQDFALILPNVAGGKRLLFFCSQTPSAQYSH